MKVRSVKIIGFKRFTDLTVETIPETAKLVILAGPNGSGKSSFFDALYNFAQRAWRGQWEVDYHMKRGTSEGLSWDQRVKVQFYGKPPTSEDDWRRAVSIRSAYRNDPEFNVSRLERAKPLIREERLHRLIENDAAVNKNYQRMVSQGLEDMYEREDPSLTIGIFRDKTIGEVRDAMLRLFPDLTLNSLGNPLTSGTFKFDKGASHGFLYQNLSGGEKAAFDLILDLIIKKREFNDTIYCIDEPEAHINTRLQGKLLDELFKLIPDNCQLWLATHSIGMMRHARDLSIAQPGQVCFLDFGDKNFDEPTLVAPATPNRMFWQRALGVALDDLAHLVSPNQLVICEGGLKADGAKKNINFDSDCYNRIFENEFPETKFCSNGSASQVESDRTGLIEVLQSIVSGVKVIRLVDRDDHSFEDVADRVAKGVRVLSRRNLECYLFDNEVLIKLCTIVGKPEQAAGLLSDKQILQHQATTLRAKAEDDVKAISGELYVTTRKRLGILGGGNDAKSFMRATLAPLVTQETSIYKILRKDIFGIDF